VVSAVGISALADADAAKHTTDSHQRPNEEVDPVLRQPALFEAETVLEVEVPLALLAGCVSGTLLAAARASHALQVIGSVESQGTGIADIFVWADFAAGSALVAG